MPYVSSGSAIAKAARRRRAPGAWKARRRLASSKISLALSLEYAGYGFPSNVRVMTMAKGQVRSNKEVRKPKKDKVAAKAAPTLGAQVKNSESATKKK
ncbi:hypothetical protein [Shinella oryzae]|uniref:Uncharacterized protein n=1 Tax=Shinella oryzae TaxID=2871820 RepID=A0ABY9K835_9HYPH|nr:hypothetical protein [Shinella oryzae]WLS04752.1 hypothetical protein Q9315_04150 [Shinella oryzae]